MLAGRWQICPSVEPRPANLQLLLASGIEVAQNPAGPVANHDDVPHLVEINSLSLTDRSSGEFFLPGIVLLVDCELLRRAP
jgi:hypothetical protein